MRSRSLRWGAVLIGLAAAARSETRPLSIEDALKQGEVTQRVPVRFSPDGKWVAYTVQNPQRIEPTGDQRYEAIPKTSAGPEALGCDVWIVDAKTGAARNLTEGKGTSWGPAWSPDSRQLAFYSDRDGLARIWAWEASSGNLRRVSDAVVRTFFNFEVAQWTPDGRGILAKVLPQGATVESIIDSAMGPASKPASAGASGGSTVVVYRSRESTHAAATASTGSTEDAPVEGGAPSWANVNRADLALVDAASGAVRRLVEKTRPRGAWFSPAGGEIAFTDLRGWKENTQQPLYDLRVVDLASGKVRTVAPKLTMSYGISVSWSPDGRSLAFLRSGQATKDECVVVDARDGRERFAAPAPAMESDWQENPPYWDAPGKTLFVMGLHAVTRVDAGTGKSSTLLDLPDGEILDLVGSVETGRYWSPDGGRSLYVAVRDGATKNGGVRRVDTVSGSARTIFSEPVFLRRGPFATDVSRDGKTVVYAVEDATHPEDLWIAGTDYGQRRRLTHVNPQLDGIAYGATRLVEWSAGTDRLRGALLLPAGYDPGKRYPLIVNVYGGSSRSNSLFRFGLSGAGVENMQLFATRGYAMLLPDTPIDRSKHSPMSEIARTVLPGVDKVVELGIADPKRLGVMGHSYGGYSTLSLVVQTDRFAAAVASASFSNLISMYGQATNGQAGSIGYLEQGQGDMGDTPWSVRDRYLANSPFFFLDKVKTPVLLVHGSLDIPARADETFVALRRLGKEVEYALYQGEQHWEGTWGFANQVDYWKRIVEWFDAHLRVPGGSS